jgi:signal transduction histidine kinase
MRVREELKYHWFPCALQGNQSFFCGAWFPGAGNLNLAVFEGGCMLLLPSLYDCSPQQPVSGDAPADGRLPLSDASAAILADAYLGPQSCETVERIARLLPGEPGLALWCVCRGSEMELTAQATFFNLARWLCAFPRPVLRWRKEDLAVESFSPPGSQRWQSLVEASVEHLEIGRWCGDRDRDLMDDPAAVVDLLHNPEGWLATVAPAERHDFGNLLPAWLTREIAARKPMVSAAFERLGEGERRAATRHAAAARNRWDAPGPGSPLLLPRVTAALDRLYRLESEFQRQVETEKLEAMAEFAAGAGHEINNPLAVISGRAQMLVRGESDPERRRDLALIHTQAMRVYEMIADMMLAARPPQPELQTVELGGLMTTVVEAMSAKADLRKIELRYDAPSEPLVVNADPTQLMVALRALCDNAFEALGEAGAVELSARKASHDSQVEIVVSDNGPGLSDTVRRHLFDPYFSGREAGRGLGVGLSKCRSIVRLHGGDIAVASQLGTGTSFTITLPATERQADGELERRTEGDNRNAD